MEGAAHIVVPGPHIVVTGAASKDVERMEGLRLNAALATTLKSNESWPWFVAQCEAKARYYEQRIVSAEGELSPREEDRHRGRVEAYRAMPRVIEQAETAYKRAVQKTKPKGKEHTT